MVKFFLAERVYYPRLCSGRRRPGSHQTSRNPGTNIKKASQVCFDADPYRDQRIRNWNLLKIRSTSLFIVFFFILFIVH